MEGGDLASSVKSCMEELEGSFSLAGITQKGELFAFKDPYGIRPLCCGYSEDRKIWAVSSETVGLDINGFEFDFEIEPGELVIASEDGFVRERLVRCEKRALCAFEFAYFARPDSRLGDKFVYEVREEFGRNLGREYPETVRNTDVIISMPETGDDAAFGLHEQTGKRWERAARRHRYVTERAFILLPEERYTTIDRKINIIDHKINGKNVAVTDDSIVRGDTTKVVVNKLRKMGAKKVYLFITFPRIIGPCFYGIDMATYGELIGSRHEPEEIAKMVGADAVNYQSVNGLIKATGLSRNELCLGCITGKYPTPLAQKMADEMKIKFEKGIKETGRIYEVAVRQHG
jgi:amidophosphoribosyltransferase